MSVAVSWLGGGGLGCEEGGAVAATRCGTGGASSAWAVCCRVKFFKSASNATGSGFLSSRFFSSLSNALGSALAISGRGARAACCGSGFTFGSGGRGGGDSGAWASTGLGGGGGGAGGGLASGLAGSGGRGGGAGRAGGGGVRGRWCA